MMTNTVRDAYRIVYNDILNSNSDLMVGKFDAEHGNEHFMFGIQYVMDWIALRVDEDKATYNDFIDLFTNNFLMSEREAKMKDW